MDYTDKIISFASAKSLISGLRKNKKSIVQCHGTFDLIHPGHIIHFEEAKRLGDVLVVSVTAADHVNKGPRRPFFNDELRLLHIAALACVDYVVLIPYPAAVEAIACIQPDIYCKGREYQDPAADVTGNIADDIRTVQQYGGRIGYVGDAVFSSTRLLNRHFETYPSGVKAFCKTVLEIADPSSVRQMVDDFSNLRVLVIGDIIFDQYTTVSVQGLAFKNGILSCRYLGQEMQAGGALAGYRHVRQFTEHVTVIGLAGKEGWVEAELSKYLFPSADALVRDDGCTTIVKQCFVEPQREGKELSKLFSVNRIADTPPTAETVNALYNTIADHIDQVDLVLAMDFGHGVLTGPIRELVQDRALFLALSCQTNSNNHGFNIINRQYHRADMFSLSQTEIHQACGRKHLDYGTELENLRQSFGAGYAWLTRGGIEALGVHEGGQQVVCPAFEPYAVDVLGAGNAFFAVTALAARADLPLAVATFLGQLAGAQAVRIIGNTQSIQKANLLKGLEGMLKL